MFDDNEHSCQVAIISEDNLVYDIPASAGTMFGV